MMSKFAQSVEVILRALTDEESALRTAVLITKDALANRAYPSNSTFKIMHGDGETAHIFVYFRDGDDEDITAKHYTVPFNPQYQKFRLLREVDSSEELKNLINEFINNNSVPIAASEDDVINFAENIGATATFDDNGDLSFTAGFTLKDSKDGQKINDVLIKTLRVGEITKQELRDAEKLIKALLA